MGVGPGTSDARLAAGVVELDRRHRTGVAQRADDAGEGRWLVVVPQPEVVGAATAFRADGGGLHHDQTGAAHRAGHQMLEMPVGGCAGLRSLGGGGVLHHRRHPDPVGDRHTTQRQRLEQLAHGISRGGRGGHGTGLAGEAPCAWANRPVSWVRSTCASMVVRPDSSRDPCAPKPALGLPHGGNAVPFGLPARFLERPGRRSGPTSVAVRCPGRTFESPRVTDEHARGAVCSARSITVVPSSRPSERCVRVSLDPLRARR